MCKPFETRIAGADPKSTGGTGVADTTFINLECAHKRSQRLILDSVFSRGAP